MSKETEQLAKQVRSLRIAVIVMAAVILVLASALFVVFRISSLRDARLYDAFRRDIERLEFELKKVK